jgi:hypothetical protein
MNGSEAIAIPVAFQLPVRVSVMFAPPIQFSEVEAAVAGDRQLLGPLGGKAPAAAHRRMLDG